ncbi:MAG: amidohydrolase family protein [Cyanobacteria bacterium RUI128]|nr:amidohydrolase family protein [Cyanobacteria bacterium RUI128]
MKTKLIIEQHIHGAFGVDFNKCKANDVLFVAKELLQRGVGGFFPTLVTDTTANITRQIEVIKQARAEATWDCAKILGVHLEGNFINPEKKGIHNEAHFKKLTVKNYQKIEDDFIKIVTLAPELDVDLIDYLKEKGVKVQAGHCTGSDLSKCDGTTHLFNAMKGISHREGSTALSALLDNSIYTEVIADGVHLSDDILNLTFRAKPEDKIILISDALPITYSNLKETVFADSKIYYDGNRATSKDGTIAGSTTLVPDVVKLLNQKGMFNPQYIDNVYEYHGLDYLGEVEWDDNFNIISITTKFSV